MRRTLNPSRWQTSSGQRQRIFSGGETAVPVLDSHGGDHRTRSGKRVEEQIGTAFFVRLLILAVFGTIVGGFIPALVGAILVLLIAQAFKKA